MHIFHFGRRCGEARRRGGAQAHATAQPKMPGEHTTMVQNDADLSAIPYHKQGNLEYYSFAAITARAALKHDPAVIGAIDIWRAPARRRQPALRDASAPRRSLRARVIHE